MIQMQPGFCWLTQIRVMGDLIGEVCSIMNGLRQKSLLCRVLLVVVSSNYEKFTVEWIRLKFSVCTWIPTRCCNEPKVRLKKLSYIIGTYVHVRIVKRLGWLRARICTLFFNRYCRRRRDRARDRGWGALGRCAYHKSQDWNYILGIITWMPNIRPTLRNLQKNAPNQFLGLILFFFFFCSFWIFAHERSTNPALVIDLPKTKLVWISCDSIHSRIDALSSLLISMDDSFFFKKKNQ